MKACLQRNHPVDSKKLTLPSIKGLGLALVLSAMAAQNPQRA